MLFKSLANTFNELPLLFYGSLLILKLVFDNRSFPPHLQSTSAGPSSPVGKLITVSCVTSLCATILTLVINFLLKRQVNTIIFPLISRFSTKNLIITPVFEYTMKVCVAGLGGGLVRSVINKLVFMIMRIFFPLMRDF